jgi:hypothetical protein
MAKGKPDIIDDVLGNIAARQPQAWHQRVSLEHADTLQAIKDAYNSGRFGKRKKPAAEAISKTLKDRGIANVQFQGVLAWLERA